MSEESARMVDAVAKTLPKESNYEYRKLAVATKAEELRDDERTDVSVITTEAVDLMSDVVIADGIDLSAYQKTMVVLHEHDPCQPVGKCLWLKPVPRGIKAKTYYTPRPEDWSEDKWLPDWVWQNIKAGVVVGKSIGFLPVEVREPSNDEKSIPEYEGCTRVITKSILCEFSVVSTPANPNALVEEVKHLPAAPSREELLAIIKGAYRQPKPKKKAPPIYRPMARMIDNLTLDVDAITASVIDRIKNYGRAD
jgi:phage head maturation protease